MIISFKDGKVVSEPLETYYDSQENHYYTAALTSGREIILEPYYEFQLQGEKALVVTFAMPIKVWSPPTPTSSGWESPRRG